MTTPKLILLIDPSICLGCRFHETVRITTPQDGACLTNRCNRLDCDNWQIEGAVNVTQTDAGLHADRKPGEAKQ